MFASGLVENEQAKEAIRKGKERFEMSGFPLLRIALLVNSSNRVKVVMFDLFAITMKKTLNKSDLAEESMRKVFDRLEDAKTSEIAMDVADFGVVEQVEQDSIMRVGDLVLLKWNSTDKWGQKCVAECGTMQGWVFRRGIPVAVEVDSGWMKWGELFLHKVVKV